MFLLKYIKNYLQDYSMGNLDNV